MFCYKMHSYFWSGPQEPRRVGDQVRIKKKKNFPFLSLKVSAGNRALHVWAFTAFEKNMILETF